MGESASTAVGGDAHHSEYHRGEMDVSEHKATFDRFMSVTVWGSALIVMGVAALTVAFAMGQGWLAGSVVWALLGVAAGFGLRLGAAWWATVIGTTVLGLLGGGVGALVGLML